MAEVSNAVDRFAFPLLVGDIGGTNARFAILPDAETAAIEFPNVRTADFPTIGEAIRTSIHGATPVRPRTAFLAIAGPVDGEIAQLTNSHWSFRPRDLLGDAGLSDIVILNDFEAQALAVVALDDAYLTPIGGGRRDPDASRIVLGPGTGLGVAGLVHSRGTWIPVPGEGGHVDMGPRTPRDHAIFPHIEPIEGRISGEQMLCGRGLVNLYRAICLADGMPLVHTDPASITAGALGGTDPVAAEAVALFATYLGRLAGDLALIFMARGGAYLSGGIAQKIVPVLKSGEFRAAFDDKAPHGGLLRSIPAYVVTHPLAALQGLAAYAREPRRFGIETRGRRWRDG